MKKLNKLNQNNQDTILNILRLARSENVSSKLFYELINFFGSAKIALDNIADFSLRGGKNKAINICSKDFAEKELATVKAGGGFLLSYNDPSYSKMLLNIYDPPPILTCVGDKNLLNMTSVAIVGARNASAGGLAFTKKIGQELSEYGLVISSGLARGVDTQAHWSSLPKTIAVIAGGIGNIYPPENKELYAKIAEQGLIIAELPYKTAPLAQHFPQRNRIISGLSSVVVVIEAGLKSGSLITAKFALEQGREVMAMPGFPLDPRSSGTNKLIKNGAGVVECAQDVINNLPKIYFEQTEFEDNSRNIFTMPPDFNFDKISVQDRKKIYNTLSHTPTDIITIAKYSDVSVIIVNVVLLELELAGKIIRYPNNKIALLYK
ncbi:MAG: DNA-processing protein DprA [Rickettsiaceae bacterium]|nr:DNA-processing protein DprA [Rickettsiaceae bacterium]